MAEIPVLEWLTASDLVFWQWNDCGWSGDVGGLVILDGTRLALCLRPSIAMASRDCYSSPRAQRPWAEADDGFGEVGRM